MRTINIHARWLVGLASTLATLGMAPPAHGQAAGVAPTSDFFVSSKKKTSHYGKVGELVAGRQRTYLAFMRFTLASPVPATGRAVLRLYPLADSTTGLIVRRATGGSWAEKSAAYSGAPKMGSGGVASGPLHKGQWVDIDVTRLVGSATAVSLGMVTTSQSPVVVASREAGVTAPQLVAAAQ
jgi:hypothetical protein